ncbi:MAG: 2,3-bisphosphoglycerate-independent phosphoglycerate mutase [Candidatus Brocadiaceae bacterium]|nr:2,3-bisphosphoglycerate-independent phosphoglycerate mutase [Candidatus Brocadiaceae bacterium]
MVKPLVLIIRDGWGIGDKNHSGNAVARAKTPNTDSFLSKYPNTCLGASGEDVGIVPNAQGSSEVGHLNIGAGRIVEQEISRLNRMLTDGTFFSNPRLLGIIENCKKRNASLHLMGLVQDQGVHATEEHLYALLKLARQREFFNVFIHFFSDGRDTPPQSAIKYLEYLEGYMKDIGVGAIASIIGRYYAMDRDRNWDRTRLAYEALTSGKGLRAASAREAIESAYSRVNTMIHGGKTTEGKSDTLVETDEFIRPTLITDKNKIPIGCVRPKDSVIFFNYRQDRAVQLSMAFVEEDFKQFDRGPRLDIDFLGFTQYYDSFQYSLIPPMDMSNILGEVLSKHGLWQLRISETQKFAHVTSFLNSKKEEPFDREDRILVDSPKVPEASQPEMSAYEVTEIVLKAIKDGIGAVRKYAKGKDNVTIYESVAPFSDRERLNSTYDVIILNFVNGDMVGHTGDFNAAVKAIEVVDECVGKVVRASLASDGIILITADHGNAEQMIDQKTGGPMTSHSLNDVEFIYIANKYNGVKLVDRGILSDIAPTMLEILKIEQPPEMTAQSLICKN